MLANAIIIGLIVGVTYGTLGGIVIYLIEQHDEKKKTDGKMPKNDADRFLPEERLAHLEESLKYHEQRMDDFNARLNENRDALLPIQKDVANIYGILNRHEIKLHDIDKKIEKILSKLEIINIDKENQDE